MPRSKHSPAQQNPDSHNSNQSSTQSNTKNIGLALGSGSARGWAHIGVIQTLEEIGIKPDIVCGTSIGALVGGMYATHNLEKLHQWLLTLDKKEILKFLDVSLLTRGGFIEGKILIDFFNKHMGTHLIEDLSISFASIATDLSNGQEVWIKEGSIHDAIRSSMALPGLFTPVEQDNTWLVDGGLVNPVPVSTCRAMGASKVIAVNLNGDILGKHLNNHNSQSRNKFSKLTEKTVLSRFTNTLTGKAGSLFSDLFENNTNQPGIFDVLASSINIMQDRITRSRMAGDPPDIILSPKLAHIGLMEFDRAEEAIEAGRKAVLQLRPTLEDLFN